MVPQKSFRKKKISQELGQRFYLVEFKIRRFKINASDF